jgi:hypothetical protein
VVDHNGNTGGSRFHGGFTAVSRTAYADMPERSDLAVLFGLEKV